jgi:hypothetical protein
MKGSKQHAIDRLYPNMSSANFPDEQVELTLSEDNRMWCETDGMFGLWIHAGGAFGVEGSTSNLHENVTKS